MSGVCAMFHVSQVEAGIHKNNFRPKVLMMTSLISTQYVSGRTDSLDGGLNGNHNFAQHYGKWIGVWGFFPSFLSKARQGYQYI